KIVQRAKASLGPNTLANLKAQEAARNAANGVLKADTVLSPVFAQAVAGKVTYNGDSISVVFKGSRTFQVIIGLQSGELREINLI
ncbi:MAG: hypothetical protein V1726_02735, partial [Methanobacteriota archaeon]